VAPGKKRTKKAVTTRARITRADFRAMVLGLEGVGERPHMDRTAFRTKRRIFATMGAGSRVHLMVHPPERRDALLLSFPNAFFSLGGWSRLGYIAVDLEKVDAGLLHELVTDAWREALPPVKAKPMKTKPERRDELAFPSATRPITAGARETILAAAPEGVEEIACAGKRPRSPSMMWKLVRYRLAGETVVTIGTFSKHAAIFFGRGTEIADPRRVLEGGGKVLRYITLRTPADAERSEVRAIVRRAFALAGP
jgi:hypothetical protein